MQLKSNKDKIQSHNSCINNALIDSVVTSCQNCFYSKGGKHSCDRHLNKIKPDYSKGVECYYNNFAHFKPYQG